MRRFYLHTRAGVYYAELIDPETGKKLPAKSTGERDKDDARDVVRAWLRTGVPASPTRQSRPTKEVFSLASILSAVRAADLTVADAEKIAEALKAKGLLLSYTTPGGLGSELFSAFLTKFWTYEESPYVAEKLAHGQRMTHEHTEHSLGRVRLHWFPAFKGKRLAELTKNDIKAFSISLGDSKLALAPGTRNRILVAGTTPLRWAFENGLISSDITLGLVTFSGTSKKRGVLTPEEASALFNLDWVDNRARVASLVAATTGLRISEVRALRAEDIDELVLQVRHGWTDRDHLKTPKNGEARRVPLLPVVRAALLALLKEGPHGSQGFIFWDPKDADQPCCYNVLANNLYKALIELHAGKDPTEEEYAKAEAYWEERAISFHSWRHYYAARMADKVEARTLML
ncbi:MAG: tyrosine-type recombinase/integrase, partial [Spirochaetota bacterium]